MKLNIEKIQKELDRRGWTRYRLAKELKIHPNSLYAVLDKGSFKTVEKIAKALETDEKDLVLNG